MPADERVLIGRVGRPHGLAGAFVVEHPSDDPGWFEVGRTLLAGGEPAQVREAKRAGGRLVVLLDRRVERGTPLEVPREALRPPAEDSYYVYQLVGLEVIEDGGRRLGVVRDVAPYAANDVLELDDGTLLPMVEDCVRQVDLDGGRIVVASGFADPE